MKYLYSKASRAAHLLAILLVSKGFSARKKSLLRGISVAMYIVGQERRLVDPPSQVVAGVRTVTTQMDERCDAHVAALIRFLWPNLPALHYKKSNAPDLTRNRISA